MIKLEINEVIKAVDKFYEKFHSKIDLMFEGKFQG